MTKYYLAVDIGASSGRLILGHLENGKMELEEVHRFENGMVKKDGELCWEFDRLFQEIKNGLKKCKEIGKIPVSMGVDTWGVDFVLMDKDDKVLGNKLNIVITEMKVWMRKYIRRFLLRIFMHVPVFRKQFSTRYIS